MLLSELDGDYATLVPFGFGERNVSGITAPRVTRPTASIDEAIRPINASSGEVANRAVANKQAAKTPVAVM